MKKRLFIAIPLPDNTKKILRDLECPGILWTGEENMHITVYFCGDVDETSIPAMQANLQKVAQETHPFELKWKTLLFGPPGRPPRMVWAEYEGNDQFSLLVQKIYSAVRGFLEAFTAEKPHPRPIPHVTLARFKDPHFARQINLPELNLEPLAVNSFQLISSELTPDGAIYTIIGEYFLINET